MLMAIETRFLRAPLVLLATSLWLAACTIAPARQTVIEPPVDTAAAADRDARMAFEGVACGADSQALNGALIEAINRARSAARRCGSESFERVPPLTSDAALIRAADGHARDIAGRKKLVHTGANGSTLVDRVKAQNYEYGVVAENIAAGQKDVGEVVAAWLESPGHCVNIMRAGVREFGAQCIQSDDDNYRRWWVSVFAAELME